MMLLKCSTQNVSKFGKLSNGHRTRKGQFSFQSQRKAMPKNDQITEQLHSSHTLSKVMFRILQVRLQQYLNHEFPDVQARFRKDRGTRYQIANICWIMAMSSRKRRRVPGKHLLLLYRLCKSLLMCGSQQIVEKF